MANTLEYKTETWAIAVLATKAAIASIQALRSESDTAASATRFIVHAESGDRLLEGVKCFPVTLTIELRMASKDAATLDTYAAEMEAAFTDTYLASISGTVNPATYFTYLRVVNGEAEEKSRTDEGRTHIVTMQLFAIAA